MSESNHSNFNSWYAGVLSELYPNRNAGFAVLMIVFPLLERYLRNKNGLKHSDSLSDEFMNGVCEMFSDISNKDVAKEFWNIYRDSRYHNPGHITPPELNKVLPLQEDTSMKIEI